MIHGVIIKEASVRYTEVTVIYIYIHAKIHCDLAASPHMQFQEQITKYQHEETESNKTLQS